MKTWEILSKTSDGEIVVVCTAEAETAQKAVDNTRLFRAAMGCPFVGVREAKPEASQ